MFKWPGCPNQLMSASCTVLFSHMGEDVGLEMQPAANSQCCPIPWSPVCYITWKPSRYVSCFKGFDKNCDDACLAGHGCALFQAALAIKSTVILNMWPENKWVLWPSKQINPIVMNCIFGSGSTRYVRSVLPEIVPNMTCGQGHFVSPILQSLLNCLQQNSNTDSTSCCHQTLVQSWREAKNWPIRLTLLLCTVSKASSGWFVQTELDFKQSWNKYYSVSSKAPD